MAHQHRPDLGEHTLFNPTLKGAMNRGVVTKIPGQMVPLAPAAETVDDAVERLPRVDATTPGLLGGSRSSMIGLITLFQRSSGHSQMVSRILTLRLLLAILGSFHWHPANGLYRAFGAF